MSVYLDASALVPLFADDPFSAEAANFLQAYKGVVAVSNFAGAEFASAVSRLARIGDLSQSDAQAVFSNFDSWIADRVEGVEATPADISEATMMLRRLDSPLRAPDAIHIAIAIAKRVGASLLTFDRKMAASAKALGLALASD